MRPDSVDNRTIAIRRNAGWCATGAGAAGLLIGFTVAPPEASQGEAARLLYLHVPAAWTAYLAYGVVLVCSVAYLRSGHLQWDRYAGAAAEIGVAMTALTIALGSIWGRAVWGLWWAWDPRLVATAMLLVCYAAYLAVRRIGTEPLRTARRSATVGIAAFTLVPVVHFSVVWWRSLHQPATLLSPSLHPPIDSVMVVALLLCVGAFTSAAMWLFLARVAVPAPEVETVPAEVIR
jgi:heme exporter protein C